MFTKALSQCIICACLTLAASLNSVAKPVNNQLDYSVSLNGLKVGAISYQFVLNEKDFQLSSHAKPVGMAAMFSKEELFESAKGKMVEDRLQPQQYRFHKTDDGKTESDVRVDYTKPMITVDGADSGIELTEGMVDELTNLLQTRRLAKIEDNELSYPIFVARKLKTYTQYLRKDGRETIDTPVGQFDTWRVVQTSSRGKYTTTYWLSEALDYFPAKIQRRDRKGREAVMALTQQTKKVLNAIPQP